MAFIPKELRGLKGLNERGQECILVGFDEQTINGYTCFDPTTGTEFTSNKVVVIATKKEYTLQSSDTTPTSSIPKDSVSSDPLTEWDDAPTAELESYKCLIGSRHVDDEDSLLYEVTRIVTEVHRKIPIIVAYRKVVHEDCTLYHREGGPVHVSTTH